MNKIFALVLISFLGFSCASHQEKAQVKEEAASVLPVTSPNLQHQRALAMVESNPDLSQSQKDRLSDLITKFSLKAYKNREKESQYRVVLMDEILSNDSKGNTKIGIVRKSIAELNRENSQNLEIFVTDFKSIIGNSAHFNQPELFEVILVE